MLPDSILVISSRFATKRESRSASSWMVDTSSSRCGLREYIAILLERGHCAQDRGQRRLEVVGQGGQQGRAQPLGLRRQPRLVDLPGQPHALDGHGGLIHQRIQKAPLVRREQHFRPLAAGQADDAHRARAGAQGRNKRFAPGSVSEPRPAGRLFSKDHFAAPSSASVEIVLGREAGLHAQYPVRLRQHDHHIGLQRMRDLVGRGPEQIVQRDDAGELLRENVERLGRRGAVARGITPAP